MAEPATSAAPERAEGSYRGLLPSLGQARKCDVRYLFGPWAEADRDAPPRQRSRRARGLKPGSAFADADCASNACVARCRSHPNNQTPRSHRKNTTVRLYQTQKPSVALVVTGPGGALKFIPRACGTNLGVEPKQQAQTLSLPPPTRAWSRTGSPRRRL